MRSSKINECFDDPAEREFLGQIVEAALGEAHETLASLKEEPIDEMVTAEDYVSNIARQGHMIKFLEELYGYLERG